MCVCFSTIHVRFEFMQWALQAESEKLNVREKTLLFRLNHSQVSRRQATGLIHVVRVYFVEKAAHAEKSSKLIWPGAIPF